MMHLEEFRRLAGLSERSLGFQTRHVVHDIPAAGQGVFEEAREEKPRRSRKYEGKGGDCGCGCNGAKGGCGESTSSSQDMGPPKKETPQPKHDKIPGPVGKGKQSGLLARFKAKHKIIGENSATLAHIPRSASPALRQYAQQATLATHRANHATNSVVTPSDHRQARQAHSEAHSANQQASEVAAAAGHHDLARSFHTTAQSHTQRANSHGQAAR